MGKSATLANLTALITLIPQSPPKPSFCLTAEAVTTTSWEVATERCTIYHLMFFPSIPFASQESSKSESTLPANDAKIVQWRSSSAHSKADVTPHWTWFGRCGFRRPRPEGSSRTRRIDAHALVSKRIDEWWYKTVAGSLKAELCNFRAHKLRK